MQNKDILVIFGFTILLWNCRSINSNLIEFKYFINKNQPDIICLTETWLTITSMFKETNYNTIRKDRFDQQIGGRVAILLNKTNSYS